MIVSSFASYDGTVRLWDPATGPAHHPSCMGAVRMTRSMNWAHRLARRQDRLLDRVRDGRSLKAAHSPAAAPDLAQLADHRYCLLVTYRRSGEPVPTPVWFAVADERLYVESLSDAGKVKRLRSTPHVLVAPCTIRGRPLGPSIEAVGRVLDDPKEESRAEQALHGKYGRTRQLYEAPGRKLGVQTAYIEVHSPVARE